MKEVFEESDGIKVYHSDISESHDDYNSKGLINLYKAENHHFWFKYRKKFILRNVLKYLKFDDDIIEIGAGTGNVSRFLMSHGYQNISVGEMHVSGLKYAKSYGIKDCYQFDLLRSPFCSRFNAVCMFDVLEHIEDSNLALKNVNKMLVRGGYVVLTLPAHNWLWSRNDKIAGHKKRYTRKEALDELSRNGFEPVIIRYFFIFIVPLLFLRKLINPDNDIEVSNNEFSAEIKINRFLNKVLSFVCSVESLVQKYLPNIVGGSLFVIGKKK